MGSLAGVRNIIILITAAMLQPRLQFTLPLGVVIAQMRAAVITTMLGAVLSMEEVGVVQEE